jgi:hypothetical protein
VDGADGFGDLELTFEAFEPPADPGLTMFAHSAEPATPSDDGLKLLASANRRSWGRSGISRWCGLRD